MSAAEFASERAWPMLVLFGKALVAAPLSTRSNETPPPFTVQGEVTLLGQGTQTV